MYIAHVVHYYIFKLGYRTRARYYFLFDCATAAIAYRNVTQGFFLFYLLYLQGKIDRSIKNAQKCTKISNAVSSNEENKARTCGPESVSSSDDRAVLYREF
jgi:hypothetical protein